MKLGKPKLDMVEAGGGFDSSMNILRVMRSGVCAGGICTVELCVRLRFVLKKVCDDLAPILRLGLRVASKQ